MSFDIIEGSRRIITVLTVVGLWPMANGTKWLVRHLPLVLHVPLSFGFIGLMLLKVILEVELSELINWLYILLTEFGMGVKFLNFHWYKRLTLAIFHTWECNEMFALRTDAEREWWRREQRKFATVVICFWFISYFSMHCFVVPELYNRTMIIPFDFWLPGWMQDEKYYYYLVTFDIVAMSWNCACNTTLDIYNCYLSFHMSLIYRLLELRLEDIGSGQVSKKQDDYIIEVIKMEQHAHRLSKNCERILCWPMLFQVFLSMFVLCFSAYRLQNLDVGLIALPYLIAMLLQIYLPCYYANEVTLRSQRLVTSLYNSQWIDLTRKNRRILVVYMVHLRRPIVFRAGRFFDIGLPLFSKVINNAYSLLALLLNMDN